MVNIHDIPYTSMLKFNFAFVKSMFDPMLVSPSSMDISDRGFNRFNQDFLGLKQCQGGIRISPNGRKLHQNYPFLYVYLAEAHDSPTWVMGPSLRLPFGSSAVYDLEIPYRHP